MSEPNLRNEEIVKKYFLFLDQHIENVINEKDQGFLSISKIASLLAISHSHLTDTVQKQTGNHPCYFYDLKIIEKSIKLLIEKDASISEVAKKLTYDPSNFSKFFKKWTGYTPGQFKKIKLLPEKEIPKSSP